MYIPRGLIWEDRSSLEDFEIDRQGTLDYAFYKAQQMVGKMDIKRCVGGVGGVKSIESQK